MGETQAYGLRTVEDSDFLKAAVKDAANANAEALDALGEAVVAHA